MRFRCKILVVVVLAFEITCHLGAIGSVRCHGVVVVVAVVAVAVAVAVAVVAAVAVAAPLRKVASERPPSAAAKLTAWLG